MAVYAGTNVFNGSMSPADVQVVNAAAAIVAIQSPAPADHANLTAVAISLSSANLELLAREFRPAEDSATPLSGHDATIATMHHMPPPPAVLDRWSLDQLFGAL